MVTEQLLYNGLRAVTSTKPHEKDEEHFDDRESSSRDALEVGGEKRIGEKA